MKAIANEYEPTELLKLIREWTELTQADFAKSINYSIRAIQHYEQGDRKCTLDTFLEIANKYDIKVTIEKKGRLTLNTNKKS